jgi:hypothetical protein
MSKDLLCLNASLHSRIRDETQKGADFYFYLHEAPISFKLPFMYISGS